MSERNPPSNTSHNNNEDEIDLRRLVGVLLDAKWLIIGITFIFMLGGVAYALLATPIYKADALLQVEKKSSGMPALSGEMADMFSQESEADTEIQIMTSRMVIGAVVDQLDLTTVSQPDYMPIVGEFLARRSEGNDELTIDTFKVPQYALGKTTQLTLLDENRYELTFDDEVVLKGKIGELAEQGDWQLDITRAQASNTQSFELTKLSRLQAINNWKSRLAVGEKGRKTGILTASITYHDGEQATQVLDAITNEYMLQNIRRNAAEAQKSLDFVQEQLPELKAELTAAEEKLNQYRLSNESVDLSLETEGMLKQVIEYEKRLNELSFKEAELARLYTEQHPQYQALLEQKERLQNEKKALTEQINELPETQQEVLRLTRDVEVNQQIYLQLLNRMQELNVMKAGTVGNVRILDEAVVQPEPVAPKKPLIVVIATLLGGMSSVGFVFVQALFNRGVENAEQLEEVGINVYASVPKSDVQLKLEEQIAKQRKGRSSKSVPSYVPLLAVAEPTDLAVEALRGLRTSLHFAMLEAKNNILMISGPSPGVGKSFITANLAVVLAQSGKKVVVIDVDLRRGYLHALLHSGNENGLSDYLAGEITTEQLIKGTEVEGLDAINRGTAPPNPSELLMHERFKNLLDELSAKYDYVLCDTPPILAVTDAAIVGRYTGTNLLVTGFAQNPVKEVEATISRFDQNGVTIKGTILNKVERKASSYYSYGYGYSYSYKSSEE